MSISASTFSLRPQRPLILPFSDSQSTVFSSSTHVCFYLSRWTEATAPYRRFVSRFISTTSETTDHRPGQRRPSGWTRVPLQSGLLTGRHSLHTHLSAFPFSMEPCKSSPMDLLFGPLYRPEAFAWQSPLFQRLICHTGHWLDMIHDPSTLISKCGLPPTELPFSMTR